MIGSVISGGAKFISTALSSASSAAWTWVTTIPDNFTDLTLTKELKKFHEELEKLKSSSTEESDLQKVVDKYTESIEGELNKLIQDHSTRVDNLVKYSKDIDFTEQEWALLQDSKERDLTDEETQQVTDQLTQVSSFTCNKLREYTAELTKIKELFTSEEVKNALLKVEENENEENIDREPSTEQLKTLAELLKSAKVKDENLPIDEPLLEKLETGNLTQEDNEKIQQITSYIDKALEEIESEYKETRSNTYIKALHTARDFAHCIKTTTLPLKPKLTKIKNDDYWTTENQSIDDHIKFTCKSLQLLGDNVKMPEQKSEYGVAAQYLGVPEVVDKLGKKADQFDQTIKDQAETLITKTIPDAVKKLNDTVDVGLTTIAQQANANISGNPEQLLTVINRLKCLSKCIKLKLHYKGFDDNIKGLVCDSRVYNNIDSWHREKLKTITERRDAEITDNETNALKTDIAEALELIKNDLKSVQDDLCIEFADKKDAINNFFDECLTDITCEEDISTDDILTKIQAGLEKLYQLRTQHFDTVNRAFSGVAQAANQLVIAANAANVFLSNTDKVLPGDRVKLYLSYGIGWSSSVTAAVILLNKNIDGNLLSHFTLDNKFVLITGSLLLTSLVALSIAAYSKVRFSDNDTHHYATKTLLIALPIAATLISISIVFIRVFLHNTLGPSAVQYHNIPAESIILGIGCILAVLSLVPIIVRGISHGCYTNTDITSPVAVGAVGQQRHEIP